MMVGKENENRHGMHSEQVPAPDLVSRPGRKWTGRAWLIAAACAAGIGCGKLGGGDNGQGNPVAPSNVNAVQGTWNGTLTRPSGQVVALRWNAAGGKVNGFDGLTGPLTLTGPTASTSVLGEAGTAGNDKLGYTVGLWLRDATPPSGCRVTAGLNQGQTGDPYPSPYTTITATSTLFVAGDCRGVFDGGSQQTNLTETVRISLSK
jgi:hypothetical protein